MPHLIKMTKDIQFLGSCPRTRNTNIYCLAFHIEIGSDTFCIIKVCRDRDSNPKLEPLLVPLDLRYKFELMCILKSSVNASNHPLPLSMNGNLRS